MNGEDHDQKRINLGTSRVPELRMAHFPNADAIVREGLGATPRSKEAVDIMLVNPPTPDGELWIRTQHRVGRRTRENMVWPQVSLAQMAALLHPTYTYKIVDANAERMGWKEFTKLIDRYQPRYYFTQVTAPTLENDMYGAFLARARGAKTIAFGTHVTPIPVETLRTYRGRPFALDHHLARLQASADFLGFAVPRRPWHRDITSLLKRNGLLGTDAWVRITVTRGVGARGLLEFRWPSDRDGQ